MLNQTVAKLLARQIRSKVPMAKKKTGPAAPARIKLGDVRGLPGAAIKLLRDAVSALNHGNLPVAERALTLSLAYAPVHAESNRLLGLTLLQMGRPREAVKCLQAALKSRTGDIDILTWLARAQSQTEDIRGAIATARDVVAQRPDASSLNLLASMLSQHGELEEAIAVAERALSGDPSHAPIRLQYARNLFYSGRVDDAAEQFRHLLREGSEPASAWYGLAEMKTFTFGAEDLKAMRALSGKPQPVGMERATLLHALGKAYEDNDDLDAAMDAFVQAAQIERAQFRWDRKGFAQSRLGMREAFATVPPAQDPQLGREVIFIVGLPRSGSTLLEQILAAHPQVAGGSELPDLVMVLRAESDRRGLPFPHWCKSAGPADWYRLGRDYLARTQRWRVDKPRFTDKFPGNWLTAEAALAMLPGARIIDCRRDPLEVCWSCYKQFFAPGRASWSQDFEDLADYWRHSIECGDDLAGRYPQVFRVQSFEQLIEDTEAQTREILEFCGLDFDAACLQPHTVKRVIRTASSAQVRQPIVRGHGSAARYGNRLDPLRRALGLATV